MPVLLRIALRNLREHRSKTIIIGTIVALGIAVLLIGNSMMDTVKAGMRKAFIDNYVGDIMITGGPNLSVFGYSVSTGNEEFPTIPSYKSVYSHVKSMSGVEASTSEVIGYGMMSVGDTTSLEGGSFAIFWGIDPESYREMFPSNMSVIEGSFLRPAQPGVLLSKQMVSQLNKSFGRKVTIGDKITVHGLGTAGFRIREVPVVGIFEFKHSNQTMNNICFVDVQTLRALNGMVLATPDTVKISSADTQLLTSSNPDSLFSGSMTTKQTATKSEKGQDIFGILGTEGPEKRPPLDSGAWNFLLIRLNDSAAAPAKIAQLNAYFTENKIPAHASDWLAASGPAGSFAYGFQTAFNILIFIVAVVAIIIIMNTLVISVIERTPEIGTMRALGAQRSFVRRMFLIETLSISIVFGVVGLIIGSAIIIVAGVTGIKAPNEFLQILFGGSALHPVLSVPSFITAAIVILAIGLVASIYPVMVALRIQPIKAIQTE